MKRWGLLAVLGLALAALPAATSQADTAEGTITSATANPDGTELHISGSVRVLACDEESPEAGPSCDPFALTTVAERHGSCASQIGLEDETLWVSSEQIRPGDSLNFDVRVYNDLGWFTPCVHLVQRDVGGIPADGCLEGFKFWVRNELCPSEAVTTLFPVAVRRFVYRHRPGEYWTGCPPYPGQERWLNLIEAHGVSCQRARYVLKPLQRATIWKMVETLNVRGFKCTYYVGDGTRPTRIYCDHGRRHIREEMP